MKRIVVAICAIAIVSVALTVFVGNALTVWEHNATGVVEAVGTNFVVYKDEACTEIWDHNSIVNFYITEANMSTPYYETFYIKNLGNSPYVVTGTAWNVTGHTYVEWIGANPVTVPPQGGVKSLTVMYADYNQGIAGPFSVKISIDP